MPPNDNSKSPYQINKKAFTLIELLVVISIISLLVAILLPALQKARATAFQAKCLSGCRQVFIASTFYANDYDEFYANGTTTFSYQAVMAAHDYITRDTFTSKSGCPYGPDTYSASSGDPIRAGTQGSGGTIRTCYGLNGTLQTGYGKPDAGPPYTPISSSWAYYGPQKPTLGRIVKHPTKVGVIICSPVAWDNVGSRAGMWRSLYHSVGYSQNGTWDIPAPEAVRHEGDGLPFAFADGHTEFVPANIIVSDAPTLVVGAAPFSLSTYTPVTAMDFSFRYLYRTANDID